MRVSTGAVFAAAAAIMYGSLGVFAKLAYAEGWNVPSLLAVRFALAAITILPFALYAGGSWKGSISAFLLGAIGYASTTAFYFPAIARLPAAVAAFLLYLAPVLVAVLSFFLLRERLGWTGLVALVLALGGLLLMSLGAFTGELSTIGVLLALGSAVTYALGIVAGRRVAQGLHWARVALLVCAGGCATYVVFAGATGQLHVPMTPRALLWAVCIGALATGIAMPLFYGALARSSASQVAVISTLEPVSTLVLAAVAIGEIPGWSGIVGGLLIIAAAALVAWHHPISNPHE